MVIVTVLELVGRAPGGETTRVASGCKTLAKQATKFTTPDVPHRARFCNLIYARGRPISRSLRQGCESSTTHVKSVFLKLCCFSGSWAFQLSVTQSRTCNKEESCAAGGHDDNDDNDDHSHSDGAARLGPLAALFIAVITIITL